MHSTIFLVKEELYWEQNAVTLSESIEGLFHIATPFQI